MKVPFTVHLSTQVKLYRKTGLLSTLFSGGLAPEGNEADARRTAAQDRRYPPRMPAGAEAFRPIDQCPGVLQNEPLMRRYAILWDFDGTILPSDPYDSEQTLLLSWAAACPGGPSPARRLFCRLLVRADRKGWIGGSFKTHYLRLLRGSGGELLDEVAGRLARKISPETRQAFSALRERGHRLIVSSCGTADLSERILTASGVRGHFESVQGNRFVFQEGAIAGMRLEVPSPQAKLALARASGLDPARTVVVGDGPTDFPLLDWAGIPVLIDRDGAGGARVRGGRYHRVRSIPEIVELLDG